MNDVTIVTRLAISQCWITCECAKLANFDKTASRISTELARGLWPLWTVVTKPSVWKDCKCTVCVYVCVSVEAKWATSGIDAHAGETVSPRTGVVAIPPGRRSYTATDPGQFLLHRTICTLLPLSLSMQRPTNELWSHTKISSLSVWPTLLVKSQPKLGMIRHFQASWVSQPKCYLLFQQGVLTGSSMSGGISLGRKFKGNVASDRMQQLWHYISDT